jgi:hypothetical protein
MFQVYKHTADVEGNESYERPEGGRDAAFRAAEAVAPGHPVTKEEEQMDAPSVLAAVVMLHTYGHTETEFCRAAVSVGFCDPRYYGVTGPGKYVVVLYTIDYKGSIYGHISGGKVDCIWVKQKGVKGKKIIDHMTHLTRMTEGI